MKFSYTTLLTILSSIVAVSADCENVGGNYYCSATKKVVYKGVGFQGTYQDVTNMDDTTGTCSQQPYSFSGNLSPLDEELSVHCRGPLKLLQFGVYYPSGSNNQKREQEDCTTRHIHHKHKRGVEIVEVTETVLVDAQGNTITQSTTQATTVEGTLPTTYSNNNEGQTESQPPQPSTSAAPSPSSSSSPSAAPSEAPSDSAWVRSSYYTPGSADNCVFLNYHGGAGSGVWSSAFGNSLSYANSDNSGGSSSPVALGDVTIGSNSEYVIMAGDDCSQGSGCGYYRPGSVAHHGFGGASKIFVFEFEMPSDGSSGFNGDMPAIWLLNAKIPRTLQYGDASCSCWKTGCGELDLFEILSSGSNKLISHLHSGQGASQDTNNGGGGSQDYFVRPTSGSLKAAVVFTGSDIHIVQVDDSTDFSAGLSADVVNGWVQESGSVASIGY
ncbi:uncharacterized protein SPAPADRAFT_61845 [Spathaspora passalidarum NRRL Y-27907]|uniref:glucan endo-1,3-beta-D-glucosidase n=1 Tax=Spathaspora passalidarum (strain NRRL Y-27907 / 11-Y1) TaxID=619300 RepID=G3ARF7_SPAPN|nr:uncharacterized protein SPAPADRAFT_61845 [Spathaspora passalidarum NRRL Y-27907]EGW31278.1 hypothetical protein SPAPADRAFT_61845 [Spathaspora passalidarum NRRL Y-27907]